MAAAILHLSFRQIAAHLPIRGLADALFANASPLLQVKKFSLEGVSLVTLLRQMSEIQKQAQRIEPSWEDPDSSCKPVVDCNLRLGLAAGRIPSRASFARIDGRLLHPQAAVAVLGRVAYLYSFIRRSLRVCMGRAWYDN